MSTVLASTSQADSATTTSSAFPFDSAAVITALSTNGASPPSQFNQVALQLSVDNVNWTEVDRRWFPAGPSAEGWQIFILANYAGASNLASYGGYSVGPPSGSQWVYYRLVFSGNVGAAVTVSASSSQTRSMAVIPLVGVTATTGGAIASWTPPMGGTGIVVERCIVNITTKSTGAANLSAGVAANATTSATNLITASAVGSAAVVLDSISLQIAASAATSIAMAAAGAVTFTGSASTVGMVGTAYIEYLLPP